MTCRLFRPACGRHRRAGRPPAAPDPCHRLDHDPDRLLGPARPDQHPASLAKLRLRRRDRSRELGGRARPGPCPTPGTLTRTCGYLVITLASSLSGCPRRPSREQLQAGQQAIAGCRVVEQDDVAGLLAAKHELPLAHRLKDVAVPDRGLDQANAGRVHCLPEAEIGHHGRHDSIARQLPGIPQRQREHGQDLVAVDQLAVRVDRQAPVRVAVIGDARRRPGAQSPPPSPRPGR